MIANVGFGIPLALSGKEYATPACGVGSAPEMIVSGITVDAVSVMKLLPSKRDQLAEVIPDGVAVI